MDSQLSINSSLSGFNATTLITKESMGCRGEIDASGNIKSHHRTTTTAAAAQHVHHQPLRPAIRHGDAHTASPLQDGDAGQRVLGRHLRRHKLPIAVRVGMDKRKAVVVIAPSIDLQEHAAARRVHRADSNLRDEMEADWVIRGGWSLR